MIDNRLTIISITGLFTVVALIYALFTAPVYQADALIQVEQKQGNSLLSSLSAMIPTGSPESAPEMQLLQSRMILSKTIDDLSLRNQVQQKYFPVFGRGWARLSGQTPGTIAISWMSIPSSLDQDRTLTLTVGEKGHYLLEGEGFSAEGKTGQLLDKDGISLKVSDIQAPPGTQFLLRQQTELEALD